MPILKRPHPVTTEDFDNLGNNLIKEMANHSSNEPYATTFSANHQQTVVLEALNEKLDEYFKKSESSGNKEVITKLSSQVDEAFKNCDSIVSGTGQAVGFKQMLDRMKEEFYGERQCRGRIIPISTMMHPGGVGAITFLEERKNISRVNDAVQNYKFHVLCGSDGKPALPIGDSSKGQSSPYPGVAEKCFTGDDYNPYWKNRGRTNDYLDELTSTGETKDPNDFKFDEEYKPKGDKNISLFAPILNLLTSISWFFASLFKSNSYKMPKDHQKIIHFYSLDSSLTQKISAFSTMLSADDATLEAEHNYVQLAFPTREQSAFQHKTAIIEDGNISKIKDALIKKPFDEKGIQIDKTKFELVMERMLRFWGIKMVGEKFEVVDQKKFEEKLMHADHNQLRMTRFIQSVGELHPKGKTIVTELNGLLQREYRSIHGGDENMFWLEATEEVLKKPTVEVQTGVPEEEAQPGGPVVRYTTYMDDDADPAGSAPAGSDPLLRHRRPAGK